MLETEPTAECLHARQLIYTTSLNCVLSIGTLSWSVPLNDLKPLNHTLEMGRFYYM